MQVAHEKLDVYQLGVEVARWVCGARFPRGMSDLKNLGGQLETLKAKSSGATHHRGRKGPAPGPFRGSPVSLRC